LVKIRLKRFGAPKRPYYRIVVVDSRKPRDGITLEEIGYYHPIEKDNQFRIEESPLKKWLKEGAQLTDTVKDLLRKNKVALS
jgi:small subunit ribosomal protein S16